MTQARHTRRHPFEVTADRLADHLDKFANWFSEEDHALIRRVTEILLTPRGEYE